MTHYLNNCKNYQYANLYGNNAFYSLYSSGPDQKYIAGFEKDDICVVISKAQGKSKSDPAAVVKVDRHQFKFKELRDYIENNGERTSVYVLHGPLLSSESMNKSAAASHHQFRILFSARPKRCSFKSRSF